MAAGPNDVGVTGPRSKFAGGDQRYLRDEQYADSSRVARRAALHARYSTAAEPWFDRVAAQVGLGEGHLVLDVGCGPGWLWEETSVPIPTGIRLALADLSAGMVDEAVARACRTGRFAVVHGQPADLQALPFADRRFDRVIANHMLYHLPDPAAGVAEIARVLDETGLAVVATNGRRHMQELWSIRGEVFGIEPTDRTIAVFGVETGFPILRDHFGQVHWFRYADELRCTDPADVVAYVCSTPPAEDATPGQRRALEGAIHARFEHGGGVMTITKDVGCFVCSSPGGG